ncbi:hypothetical protein [Georgenia sp. Z1491]|uniref:hypothetical protein n=1 Tax=Georgenia sp. Z1491 TaxID=3416707 RepID=UPI003CEF3B22
MIIATSVVVLVLLSMPVLGRVGVHGVRCEVVGASAAQGERVHSAGWRVLVETEDCRTVVYTGGVTADTAARVADGFTPGAYEFEMSALDRIAATGWAPGLSPSAEEFRRVR